MVDYKAAVWRALRHVFPDTVVHGCVFYLTQAIWRKVQQVGLQTAYIERRRTHTLILYAICYRDLQFLCDVGCM